MKTSIIVSSFAALCLMITFNDAPKHFNTYSKNALTTHSLSFAPTTSVNENSSFSVIASTRRVNPLSTAVKMNDDFSYLRFDVADYMSDNEAGTEAIVENTFDYLKFNVSEYMDRLNVAQDEEAEVIQSEFEYLKFDVNNFVKTDDLTDAPDNFRYLRFDVTNYSTETLPETENTAAQ